MNEICILYNIGGYAKKNLNINARFVIVHVRSTANIMFDASCYKLYWGKLLQVVLGQVVTTVTTLGRLVPMAHGSRRVVCTVLSAGLYCLRVCIVCVLY